MRSQRPAANRSSRSASRSPRKPRTRRETVSPGPARASLPLRRRTIERLLDHYPGEHPATCELDTVFRPGPACRGADWRARIRRIERRGTHSDISECAGLLVFCQEARLIRDTELPGWLYRVLHREWRRCRLPGINNARMGEAARRGADVLARLGLLAP